MCCEYDYVEDFFYELQEFDVAGSSISFGDIRYTGEETHVAEFAVSEE